MRNGYFLYPVHPSHAFVTSPSLAASYYMALLTMLSKRYLETVKFASACFSDQPLTADEVFVLQEVGAWEFPTPSHPSHYHHLHTCDSSCAFPHMARFGISPVRSFVPHMFLSPSRALFAPPSPMPQGPLVWLPSCPPPQYPPPPTPPPPPSQLLESTKDDCHPDAHACRLKIVSAYMEGLPKLSPPALDPLQAGQGALEVCVNRQGPLTSAPPPDPTSHPPYCFCRCCH